MWAGWKVAYWAGLSVCSTAALKAECWDETTADWTVGWKEMNLVERWGGPRVESSDQNWAGRTAAARVLNWAEQWAVSMAGPTAVCLAAWWVVQ